MTVAQPVNGALSHQWLEFYAFLAQQHEKRQQSRSRKLSLKTRRDLALGEILDGEGGYTVWGKLLPADTSLQMGGLPLGLAHQVKVVRAVKKGQSLSWADVAMDTSTPAYKVRHEMEAMFSPAIKKAA